MPTPLEPHRHSAEETSATRSPFYSPLGHLPDDTTMRALVDAFTGRDHVSGDETTQSVVDRATGHGRRGRDLPSKRYDSFLMETVSIYSSLVCV
jgi:hypothetical protein